jgi:hypothetical protein
MGRDGFAPSGRGGRGGDDVWGSTMMTGAGILNRGSRGLGEGVVRNTEEHDERRMNAYE